MKRILVILLMGSLSLNAQLNYLEHETTEDVLKLFKKQNGPNEGFYFYQFFGFGSQFSTITPAQLPVNNLLSYDFSYGFTFKYSFWQYMSIGADLSYFSQTYSLKNTFVNNVLRQKFVFHNFGATPFLRIMLGKYGNTVGNYLDLGFFVSYAYSNKEVLDYPESQYYSKMRIVYYNRNFFNKFAYGPSFRIGSKWFSIFAKYRMTDLVGNKKDEVYLFDADLPKLTVGIEFAFVQ